MEEKHKYIIGLAALFLVVLGIRFNMAFRYSEFNDDNAYFILRQVEHIRQTGLPLYVDELSYGGRTYIFLPLYHYVLAFFSLFIPLYTLLKLLPNIFASLLMVVVFVLSYEITKNRVASLLSSILAGFIPIFMSETVNSGSSSSLFVPLSLMLIFYYIRLLDHKKYAAHFAFVLLLLILLSPITVVFIIGLLFYLLLCQLERKMVLKREYEISLFSLIFYLWLMFVVFKNTLLTEGTSFVWKSVPSQLVSEYFAGVNPVFAIYSIGALPLLFGIHVAYIRIFEERRKDVFVIIGFLISISLASWFRIIEDKIGLMLAGAILCVLSADFFRNFATWLKKTKFSRHGNALVVLIFILMLMMSIIPSLDLSFIKNRANTPKEDELKAILWLKENTEPGSVVLASPGEGHKISFLAGRKNVMDSNYNYANNPEQRFKDVNTIFSAISEIEAVSLCQKFDVGYIYLSENTLFELGQSGLRFIPSEGDNCFKLVYDEEPLIYKVECRVAMSE
ncbi:hypothetical protein JXA85_02655 [Candidatus Woesearchaeota archaeon]|nr:hypothetical protein [Candidatus Woesearchaeota archaeon]